MPKPRKSSLVATGIILMFSIFYLFQVTQTVGHTSFEFKASQHSMNISNQPSADLVSSTYFTGIYDIDSHFLSYLCDHLDVEVDYDGFCAVIEHFFLPLNIHLLGVHNPSWQDHANITSSDIPFLAWLDTLLSACDKYGINVIFWLPHEWSAFSGWDMDVLAQFPELETLDASGKPPAQNDVNHLIIDHPLLLEQFKEDLKQLYEQYGHHASWTGFGAFYGDNAYYAESFGTSYKDTGFDPYTIENFAKSKLFLREINATGFHLYYKNGTLISPEKRTKSKIWGAFFENEPIIKLSSGLYNTYVSPTSDVSDVYGGTGNNAHVIMVRFQAPKNLNAFKIKWYGYRSGTPGDVHIELYRDRGPYKLGEFPANLGSPLETTTQKAESITSLEGWQLEVSFNASLTNGDYYWLVFQAEGDKDNYYFVYRKIFRTDDTFVQISTNGYLGPWGERGGAIIWIKDAEGNDVKICPFQGTTVKTNGSTTSFTFMAPKNITFNTLILFVPDRQYDERDTVVKINAANGTTLASGLLSMYNMKGIYLWGVHVPLNRRINILKGESYTIVIERAPAPDAYFQFVYITTDPPRAGFQGNGIYPLFALSDMDIIEELQNYDHWTCVPIGADPVTDEGWAAVRIKPSVNARLSNVNVKIAEKYGAPSNFEVVLYSDFDGTGKKPGSEVFEIKTVPEKDITSSGWVETTDWSYHLNADTYYWIVFKMAVSAPGGYKIYAKTNPYLYRLMYTRNKGQTWERGFPITASPGEPIFRVETEAEVFRCEPEELISFRIGGPMPTDGKEIATQSFSSSADIVIRGVQVWMSKKGSGFSDLIAEIREDGGADEPSPTIIASSVVRATEYSYKGMVLFDFKFPVNLTAGKKYWLVIRSQTTGASCILSIYHEPEYSFGGTLYKAKISTDGGQTWSLPQGKEADLLFAFIKSPSIGDYFNLQALTDDIITYHTHNVTDEPLWGWNSYLNLQTSKLLKELAEWFEGYTGKKWIIFDVNPLNILFEADKEQKYLYINNPPPCPSLSTILNDSILYQNAEETLKMKFKWSNTFSIGNLGCSSQSSSGITSEQIRLYYLLTVPLLASRFSMYQVSEDKIVDENQQKWSRFFGEVLKRMKFFGDFYGKEIKAVKALFIGDSNVGITLQFLTPSIDVTLCGFEGMKGDYNLTIYDDFSNFDVIVWWSNSPSMEETSENVKERIKAFVENGGGFVVTGPWAEWANEILGLDCLNENISTGSITFVNFSHPITMPFTNISEYTYYWRNLRIAELSSEVSYVVKDSNGQPWISANRYGNGRAILCGSTQSAPGKIGTAPNTYGAPKDSYLILLNNAIFYAAKKESMIPAWWYESTYRIQHPWHWELRYSICGKYGGPILLWISNNNETTRFEIHLNASFYGINPDGWLALDVQHWTVVTKGSGENITINAVVPAKSWMPIYVMSLASNSTLNTQENSQLLSQTLIINSSTIIYVPVILTLPFKRKRLPRNFKLHRITGERVN
jgi:hypothetical protein